MTTDTTFSITRTSRKSVPNLPYETIKDGVLGRSYSLSLVFVGNTISRRLNRTYRGKDKPANILSFPLSDKSGEIFIDLSLVRPENVGKFFIHGLLHLKGMQHGDTMDKTEDKLESQYLNGKTLRSRHRHRHN